jgi:23S rRNA (cytosine1962-C5)-methyltransferase
MVSRGGERPERAFWRQRVAAAVATRAALGLLAPADACRLVAGDADGVPGLVVDRYADVLVCQSGTQGADRLRDLVLDLVRAELPWKPRAVVDRSDTAVRRFESLEKRVEVLEGALPEELLVRDGDLAYEVDVLAGHKTGHYLDQRDNRRRAAAHARGTQVLDAFSYDGLFAVRAALAGAASVHCIDQSQPALDRAKRNAERNGVADRITTERADCMDALRERARAGERYGLVIADPPAFAKNRRELEGAARGYVELNARALELVADGGHLVTASCSYAVKTEVYVELLRAAAARTGRLAWLEELHGASLDHPQLLTLPETAYLKCAFLRVGGTDSIRAEARDGVDPGQRRDA